MVAGLFVVLLLVFGGGYNTVPVFIPALLRAFPSWSHQKVSILPSVLALSVGIFVLPVGWLIDRVEARRVMLAGVFAAGASFLLASRANGLNVLIAAYFLLGFGIAAGTVLPAALVIANWFEARRGIAMGIANSGSTTGGMVMTLVAGYLLRQWSWRAAYWLVGSAMIIMAAPIIAVAVHTRPPGAFKLTVAEAADRLRGFELRQALHARSFWMIAGANFCFAFSATGTAIHLIAHLEGIGYSRSNAALIMSLVFGFATLGKIVMGLLADWVTARLALALDFTIQAVGVVLIFYIAHPATIVIFIVLYGISVAAPLMLLPLLTAESLGLRRFGLLSGLTGLAQTFGAAIGPLVSGRIFDLTGSYSAAFELFIVINLFGALAAVACRSYSEESAIAPAGVSASA